MAVSSHFHSQTGEHLFWPIERWRGRQRDALRAHVAAVRQSPLYAAALAGVPNDAPLAALPVTTKDDLASAAAGDRAMACPRADVREWVTTSGTLGKPLYVPMTENDLARLAANEACALRLAGVSPGGAVLMAVSLDRLFVAGLAYWLGARAIGAACARLGPQSLATALPDLLARTGPAHLIAVPSYLRNVPDLASFRGRLTSVIAIGEPTRGADLTPTALAAHIGETLGCPVLSTYASTETCTTFAESPACVGGHLNPELACVEILANDGSSVPVGEVGEVTVTPLGVTGMPLLRFRTGDMAALYEEPCPCGRTTPRLGPILGRRQHLLKLRGTSVYPAAILDAVHTTPEAIDCVVEIELDGPLSDRVTVHVHVEPDTPAVRRAFEAHLRGALRVLPDIAYVNEAGLRALRGGAASRKPQRVIDRRSAKL